MTTQSLADALRDAAMSLEAIANSAGDDLLLEVAQVRAYARNRAIVARSALALHDSAQSAEPVAWKQPGPVTPVGRRNARLRSSVTTHKREARKPRTARKFDEFVSCLEAELKWRYECDDINMATPATILLAVLNSVAAAKNAATRLPRRK